jgi:hypothetical protein
MAVVSNGVVTGVVVTETGAGYTGIPTIQIDPPTGVALAGQSNVTFSISGATTNNAGVYYVVVSNNYGSVASALASLTISTGNSNVVQNPPVLSLASVAGGVQLALAGAGNGSWVLQCATNLAPPAAWQPIYTNPAYSKGNWQFTDTNLNGIQKFYRVVSAPGM